MGWQNLCKNLTILTILRSTACRQTLELINLDFFFSEALFLIILTKQNKSTGASLKQPVMYSDFSFFPI